MHTCLSQVGVSRMFAGSILECALKLIVSHFNLTCSCLLRVLRFAHWITVATEPVLRMASRELSLTNVVRLPLNFTAVPMSGYWCKDKWLRECRDFMHLRVIPAGQILASASIIRFWQPPMGPYDDWIRVRVAQEPTGHHYWNYDATAVRREFRFTFTIELS